MALLVFRTPKNTLTFVSFLPAVKMLMSPVKKSDVVNVLSRCLPSAPGVAAQEYKRKQIEEQRQAERLQRQLQQERAYLVSLQQQQEPAPPTRPPQDKKQLYHYKDQAPGSNDKPAWAKEVGSGQRSQGSEGRVVFPDAFAETVS